MKLSKISLTEDRLQKELVNISWSSSLACVASRKYVHGINWSRFLSTYSHIFIEFQIRGMVSSKLEVWLTNPKLKRSAQELLMSVCVNCTSNTQRDVEIVASIVKIRLKTKDLSAFYFACIRWLFFQVTLVILKNNNNDWRWKVFGDVGGGVQ